MMTVFAVAARLGARMSCAVCLLALLAASGCATIGRPFATHEVSQVRLGQTTQSDVLRLFGAPWRTGLEDGQQTWTYGHYKYSLFSREKTCDLVVRFDERNVVVSYTFNSTEPDDLQPQAPAPAK
jgi:outer membrane protein assembly factor BamE (lipoprotein component of BamABCDE complex)